MSWHFSLALEGEFLGANSLDGEPCVLWNSMPFAQDDSCSDKMKDTCHRSPFGMMYVPSTDGHGEELLTWFLAGFPARTSAQQESGKGLTESEAGFGWKWPGSLAKYDPSSRSWRTRQCSLLGDLTEFSETWPRWGSMRDGECSEQTTLAPPTSASGFGSWPTPTVPNGGRSCAHVTDWRSPTTAYHNGKKVQVGLEHAVRHWPTPTASLGTKGGRVTPRKSREGGTLIEAVSARTQFATPTVKGNYNRKGASSKSGDGLATQVGGSLNPTWVEWLMNWPIGWTALEPMNEREFQYWQAASATEGQGSFVREMWFNREAGAPPQGPESNEQRSGKSDDSVFYMPPHGTQEDSSSCMRHMRNDVQAETPTQGDPLREFELQQGTRQTLGRTAVGVSARADRLKAIGNGQVPLVAARAWRVLTSNASLEGRGTPRPEQGA